MPSSLVRYYRQRPTLPPRKISKAEWLFLYHEAVRLGFEPPPVSAGPSADPQPPHIDLTIQTFRNGGQLLDWDLFNTGLVVTSVCVISTELEELVDDDHPGSMRFQFLAHPLPISEKQFPFTEQTLPYGHNALFYVFQAFVFPAGPVDFPSRLIYAAGVDLFTGPLSSPSRIDGGYLSAMQSPPDSSCMFTMSSVEITSLKDVPEMATSALISSGA
jgi:hypothetical protein